jgi:D-alanyl-lipoteichoic acid acyltransferase DltB (MBOAT superfamily)
VLFPTIRFALFFAVVLPVSWLLMPERVRWRAFILCASCVFYGSWDWRFVPLLLGSIVANQVFANAIARAASPSRSRRWLAAAVVANLGTLAWFKYAGFLAESGGSLLRLAGFDVDPPLVDVVLPVGISFFTFQALSYVIDVHRREVRPASLLDFAVYLSFFPHLVAGPIVRASELIPQLRHRRDARHVDASLAFWLITAGLFKKVVVANYLAAEIVDPLFAVPGQHGGFEALAGIYAYAIQIYADFSGYTDIAIGVALLLGFRFPQNFDAPYSAVSLQDFWRRWHMTLSRWLRDYLYIPLGGGRGSQAATYRNLMLTMLLGGLWHGAAWTFVVWGGMHGAGLALEHWSARRRTARPGAAVAPRWVRRIVTFHIVCLAWVFFRADSFGGAVEVLARLWQDGTASLAPMVLVVIALVLAVQQVPPGTGARLQVAFSRWSAPAQAGALGAVLVVIDALGPTGVAPFIYFQF